MGRRKSPALRFAKRHPAVVLAAVLGGTSGFGVDHLLDVAGQTQLIVSAVVAVLLLVGKMLLGVGYGAIYRFWVWHPADMGLPENQRGMVCGYIGKTRQRPEERYRQHMGISARYRTAAQPWADTVAGWEVIHESRYMTNLGLHLRERGRILVHRPLYNYTMNLANPHRITKTDAQEQRADRDALRAVGAL